MKVNNLFAVGVAAVAVAAYAAMPQTMFPIRSMQNGNNSVAPLRLTQRTLNRSSYDVGPLYEADGNVDGIIRITYSCASTILSSPFNAVFNFNEDEGTVTIENFGGFAANDEYKFRPDIITAPFSDGVITIPCSGLGPDEAGSTKLGVLEAYGMDLYLRVGKIEFDENFMSSIPEAEPELKLYVSEDFSTIETRLEDGQSVAGVIDYTDLFGMWACSGACKGGMSFSRIESGPLWEISDNELDFGTMYTSTESRRSLTIKSKGDEPIDFVATTDSPLFTVSPVSGTVGVSDKSVVTVCFNSPTPGDYEGTLTITAGGKVEKIKLTGKAEDRDTDFSTIVTEGDASLITWENVSENAWSLEGNNAVYRCANKKTSGVLKASFSGLKPKRITFDVKLACGTKDGLSFNIEGHRMFDYNASLNHTVSYIIPGGSRSVEFVGFNSDYSEGNIRIGNLHIENVDTWEALSPDGSVTPLTGEGFVNINGNAVANSTNSVMMLSLNLKDESNLSFDYEAGSSEVSIELNESQIGKIATGEKGTFHYDFASGASAFIMIKVKTPAEASKTSYASISNLRFSNGKYHDTSKKYNAIVGSYLGNNGSYTSVPVIVNYSLDITLTSGGKAFFSNLLPDNNLYPDSQTIEGTWEGNKIHIPTWKNINIGTIAAYDNNSFDYLPSYWGYRYWLVAGKINSEIKQTEILDELTFTISEDGSTIIPDSDFGVWSTNNCESKEIVSFYSADSKFVAVSDEASIAASATNVIFGNIIANGYDYSRSVSLLAAGADCEYSAVIEGDDSHFTVSPANGVIKAGQSALLNVGFSSTEPGVYNAVLKIYSDGNDLEIPLTANVEDLPDYSVVVTDGRGLISFDSKYEYPWKVDDGVAVSTNEGVHNSKSILGLDFAIPHGKIAIFGLKGATCAEPNYDGFAIVVNGETIYSDVSRNENVDVEIPFEEGEYKIQLMHVRDSKDELYSAYDRTIVKELSLKIMDPGVHHIGFEPPYKMLAPVGEVISDVVTVCNLTDEPVTITSVEGSGCFGALMPEKTILEKKSDSANIPVTFLADKDGEFTGTITVHTSAGNIEIPVSATADYVKYIGAAEVSSYAGPYVTILMAYGETECTSTMLYPSDLMTDLKGAKMESLTFFPTHLPDYTFSCPNIMAEVGESDSYDFTMRVDFLEPVMTGEMVDADNWELTIPFDTPYQYNGGNFLFQLTNLEKETFGGHTPIQMAFRHFPSSIGKTIVTLHDMSDAPVETLPYMRVKYDPTTVGIDDVKVSLSEVSDIEFFSIEGIRLELPVKGLNVVVTHYSDGKTRSAIMLKR